MKIKIFFILTILILSNVESVNGFKEFKDTFDNENFIQSHNNLTYNETLKSIHLKWVSGAIYNYDFTTFTEVDENNVETYNANNITIVNYQRTSNLHLYKDLGAGNIGDFTYYIDIRQTAGDTSASVYMWFAVTANSIGDYQEISNLQGLAVRKNLGNSYLYLYDKGGGAGDVTPITQGTWYYIVYSRIGSTLTAKVYTDSARTNLYDTLTQTSAQTTTWRYLYASMGFDYVSDAFLISCKIANLREITEGYKTSGILYTKNIMENFTKNTYSLLYNFTIPTSGSVKISYSKNNSSWVNHFNVTGYDTLDNHNAINLLTLNFTSPLYIKIEVSTTNIFETPYLNDYRLMVTDSEESIVNNIIINPEVVKPNLLFPSVFLFPMFFIVVVVTLGLVMKRR